MSASFTAGRGRGGVLARRVGRALGRALRRALGRALGRALCAALCAAAAGGMIEDRARVRAPGAAAGPYAKGGGVEADTIGTGAPSLALVPVSVISRGQATADARMQPERVIEFALPQREKAELSIRQVPGSALGSCVWTASVELVRFLAAEWGQALRGARVLELGAGTGSTAIALAKFAGAHVTATDGNPELVDLMRANAAANGVPGSALAAQPYVWGDPLDEIRPLASTTPSGFDLVIGAEITALRDGHAPLVQTLCGLFTRGARTAVLAETRRNKHQPRFWEMLSEAGCNWHEASVVAQSDHWNIAFGTEEPVRIFCIAPRSPAGGLIPPSPESGTAAD